jgi:hypothetical protein
MDQILRERHEDEAEDEGFGTSHPMIKDDDELERTREALVGLESALEAIRSRNMHPDRLKMWSDGYLVDVNMLKSRIQAYEEAHATSAR